MKWIIPITTGLLAGISLVSLSSIAPDLMPRQLSYFLLGYLFFFLINKLKFQELLKYSGVFYVFTILALFLLLVLGISTRSTVRWINLPFGFKIQPSQFVPLVVSLFLASRMKKLNLDRWRELLKFSIYILIPAVLVFLQPDFGTSIVISISLFSILLISKIRIKQLLMLLGVFLFVLLFAWFFVLKPYQKARITGFISPQGQVDQNSSYNARQALIAVGSGQLFGRGLGAGVQSHLRFLPERQTDFIFASIAEEWGFIGSMVIIMLYLILLSCLLYSAYKADDLRIKMILIVLFVNLFLQISINIGMNIGLLPITGLTLPLLSYGGSSILSFMIFLGLAFNVISLHRAKVSLNIK